MRKIDIAVSRDYYKQSLHSALNLLTIMAKRFEEAEHHYRERIEELEKRGAK